MTTSREFARPKAYAARFERHAAPEAIKEALDDARKRCEEIQQELGWLEGFYLRRIAEKAAGTWPPLDKINSACENDHHSLCPGTVYIGHANDAPRYGTCECGCHA